MALIDAAAADGPQPFPRMHAFNMFGQGVAYFQSVMTLVSASQPTEALFTLRALAAIAGRFEQFCEIQGQWSRTRATHCIRRGRRPRGCNWWRHSRRTRRSHAASQIHYVQVPDDLPAVEETSVWRSLHFEAQLAEIAQNPLGVVGLHQQQGDSTDHLGFHTHVASGPFTELIASAAVIAVINLLKNAAPILDLSLDADRADEVLQAAVQRNERSADALPRE